MEMMRQDFSCDYLEGAHPLILQRMMETNLEKARAFIDSRKDRDKIVVEVLPLTNYVRSAEEHQHHLERYPEDCSYCHIPDEVLNKYRNQ